MTNSQISDKPVPAHVGLMFIFIMLMELFAATPSMALTAYMDESDYDIQHVYLCDEIKDFVCEELFHGYQKYEAGQVCKCVVIPYEGWLLSKVIVEDERHNAVEVRGGSWYNDTASFVMPKSDVTIRPVLVKAETAEGLYINMPKSDSLVANIPEGVKSFKIFDDGGENGAYSEYCNGHLKLISEFPHDLQISGNVTLGKRFDEVSVDEALYGRYEVYGSNYVIDYVHRVYVKAVYDFFEKEIGTHAVGLMETGVIVSLVSNARREFHYKESKYSGIDFTVSVLDPNENHEQYNIDVKSVDGGLVSVSENAVYDNKDVVAHIEPNDGYVLSGISVVDKNNDLVNVYHLQNNDITWTMPKSDVSVIPVFNNAKSAEDGLYVNIPMYGYRTFELSEDVPSVKVYDHGGPGNGYDISGGPHSGYLVLTAPEDYALDYSGSMQTHIGDTLRVYDGIYDGFGWGNELMNFGRRYEDGFDWFGSRNSSSNNITIYFDSKGKSEYYGVDLTVKLVKKHSITINNGYAGSLVSNKKMAIPGELITLTATPKNGYLFTGISAIDDSGAAISTPGVKWYKNVPYFSMPSSSVMVTPEFSSIKSVESSLSVYMPMNYKDTVQVPVGIKSFKIDDDVEVDCAYNDGCQGNLVLTAPAGYKLQLSGTVETKLNEEDEFTIYDVVNGKNSEVFTKTGSGTTDVGSISSSERELKIRKNSKKSSGADYHFGLDLTVTLVECPKAEITVAQTTGGSVVSNMKTAGFEENVSLTVTPDEGYIIKDIVVKTSDGEIIPVQGVSWYDYSAPVTFNMPNKAVTVTPEFIAANAEEELYVDLSGSYISDGIPVINIPKGVDSFKVRCCADDGNSHAIALVASKDDFIQISGSMQVNNGDKLTAYDGVDESYASVYPFFEKKSQHDNCILNIGPVTSKDNRLKIYFDSNGKGDSHSLDLTVKIKHAENLITIKSVSGGGAVANEKYARKDQLVELTATPDEGYVFTEIMVHDENGEVVPSLKVEWQKNRGYFYMPLSPVTVTPVFSTVKSVENSLSINLNRYYKDTVQIPVGIQSFKIYDDSGRLCISTNGCESDLFLNAPAGYRLQLSGEVDTKLNEQNELIVYDVDGESFSEIFRKNGLGTMDVGTLLSSKTKLRIHTNTKRTYFGDRHFDLDLTVTLVKGEEAAINVVQTTGGSVVSSKNSAGVEEIVSLTVIPDDGYIIKDVVVETSDGVKIPVQGISWYDYRTPATFSMPNKAVTITPEFVSVNMAENLYVDPPVSYSTHEVNIPKGIESFRIRHNGDYEVSGNFDVALIAPEGSYIKLAGTMTTIGSASIRIEEGPEYRYQDLFYKSAFGNVDIGPVTSKGSSVFVNTYAGNSLDILVQVVSGNLITVENVQGGHVLSDRTEGGDGHIVSLSALPDDGYLLKDILVMDLNGAVVPVSVGSFLENKASFVMPASAVTVTPVFTNTELSVKDSAAYIKMPYRSSLNFEMPSLVQSLRIYSSKGYENNYLDNSGDSLTLVAPEGRVLYLTGTVTTEAQGDFLTVFDGASTDSPVLLDAVSSMADGVKTKIDTVASSGTSITLTFKTNGEKNYVGLDLVVYVVDPNASAVVVDQAQGGIIRPDKMNALGGETVTLNVFPDEGFLLAYLNVVDSDNQKVNVVYENGGASFIMPPKSVSVTPIFTNTFIADGEGGFYINMPKDGLDTAYIPIYMPSFNVYDHSGKDGYYTFSSDGSLLLSAPEDYVLQVDGNVKLMRTTKVEDYLDIHDGNSTDAPYKRFRNTTAQGYVLNVRDTSSTNEMLLHFVTDGSGFVADVGGVYLTVSLIKSLAHADVSVAEIPAQTYTGSAICPAVSVTDGQMRLVENVDYTIECLNNVSAGMNAQVKIAGIGNYCGKIFAPFEIAPKEISIAWSEQTSFVYDGYEHAPSAVAEGLLNDDECSIVVSGATDVGDHVAVAKALSNGNYRLPAENLEKPFKITYTDLAALRADYVVSDGEVLVGELLGQWYPFKVSIADGATVTFDGMSIKGFDASDYNWAGLTCEGDCNIILADNSVNTVEGFYSDYPGIYVPVGKTLTISGSGSLETRGGRRGAGIGGGNGIDCGNIAQSRGFVVGVKINL